MLGIALLTDGGIRSSKPSNLLVRKLGEVIDGQRSISGCLQGGNVVCARECLRVNNGTFHDLVITS